MRLYCRTALTRTETVVSIAAVVFFAIIVAIRWPYVFFGPLPRGPHYRSTCGANLKGLGTAMYTYANENQDQWAVAFHRPATVAGTSEVTYVGQTGHDDPGRGIAGQPGRGDPLLDRTGTQRTDGGSTQLSVTRNMYVMIHTGVSSPLSFICPTASTDRPANEKSPLDFWDFGEGDNGADMTVAESWATNSYAYQVPYGRNGQPSTNCDPRMALAADKGPYGAALEAGYTMPPALTAGLNSSPKKWQPWNSPNHGGEGQNVLYTDCHVEFQDKPTVGVQNDNIYTRWSDATGGTGGDVRVRIHGTPPTKNETPFSDTDTLIYP